MPLLGRQHRSCSDNHLSSELGQTMVEYGMIVSVISVALIVVLSISGFGTTLSAYYDNIVASF